MASQLPIDWMRTAVEMIPRVFFSLWGATNTQYKQTFQICLFIFRQNLLHTTTTTTLHFSGIVFDSNKLILLPVVPESSRHLAPCT